jgi:hypothetical protein
MSDADLIPRRAVTEILFDEGWYGDTLSRLGDIPPAVIAELPEVQALIAAAVMEAYALGFDASGEGFNGEFPLDGNHRNVADWQKMRDADLAALVTPDAQAALEAYRVREVAKLEAKLALVQRALEKTDEGLEYMGLYAIPEVKP